MTCLIEPFLLKEWKQKIRKKIWKPFHPWLRKGIDLKKFGLTGESNLLELLKGFAFAERTIRALKTILYRYMEDFGYNYIHKLLQFVTTLYSRGNIAIDMRPNTVKNGDFMSFLYSKLLRENKKPTIKIGERLHFSNYDLPFCKDYKPQFTQEVFGIVAIARKKPPTYTIKDEQGEVFQGKFYQKELIKVN